MSEEYTLERQLQFDRKSLSETSRSISLSFSSELPVKDFSWAPPQVLLHNESAVRLKQLRELGAVLFNHDANRIVGPLKSVAVDTETHRGSALISFDSTEEGNLALERVKSGSLRGVSLSAVVHDYVDLEPEETYTDSEGRTFTGPLRVATSWTPTEISLTPIPADAGVGVNRSGTTKEEPRMKLPAEVRKLLIERGMPEGKTDDEALEFLKALPTAPEASPREDTVSRSHSEDESKTRFDEALARRRAEETERGVVARERERVSQLQDIQRRSGIDEDELHRWIQNGVSAERAREEALEFMSERHRPIGPNGNRVEVILDAKEKLQSAMEAHLARRAKTALAGNPESFTYDEKACEDISPDMPTVEVARHILVASGVKEAKRWDRQTVAQRALQHSTSDFPYLLQNIANKSLGVGYTEARTTWNAWCGVGSLPDFKSASRVAVGDTDSFEIVKELMPITEATMAEKRETRSLSTYAKRFGISRQGIVNDDLAEFSRIPQRLGAAAARTVNATVYSQLTSPPTMAEDSKALFATDHTSGSNYTSSGGGAPSATTLSAGLTLMRKQKGVGAVATLNIVPRYMIVPAALEQSARTLLEGQFNPVTQATATPRWVLGITPVVEPLLDATSAAVWYLAASPNDIDTIRVEFLNGVQTPQIVPIDGTAILGKEWVAYIDFSVKVFDHRGLYKNIGA